MKNILFCAGLVATASLFAAPEISIDAVRPRNPWNGVVDIDYTITGLGVDAENYVVTLKMTSAAKGAATTLSNFVNHARVDLPVKNGENRVAWDSGKDGFAEFSCKDASFAAELAFDPVLAADAQYMIVDVSDGKDATNYPVRYARGELTAADAEQFNRDAYKTDKIVFSKVKAAEFWVGIGKVFAHNKRPDMHAPGELSPDGTLYDGSSAVPTYQHRVKLTRDYWVGLYELTQGQYKNVIGTNPAWESDSGNFYIDLRRPVNKVSFTTLEGAGGFLPLLSAKATSRGETVGSFTLPTEAQLENVCRCGTISMFEFQSYQEGGSANGCGWLNWHARTASTMSNALFNDKKANKQAAAPVGSCVPNRWGFCDTLGNVWEVCSDPHCDYTVWEGTLESPDVDPVNPGEASKRVCRGGTHNGSDFYTFNSGTRGSCTGADSTYGFRLALTIP